MRHIPEDELHAYLDQALSRSQCVEIESHLAGCAGCQGERDAIAALRDRTTALLATLAPPRRFTPAADVVRERAAARTARQAGRWRAAAWAASLLLAVGLGWGGKSLDGRPDRTNAPAHVLAANAPDTGVNRPAAPDTSAAAVFPAPTEAAAQAARVAVARPPRAAAAPARRTTAPAEHAFARVDEPRGFQPAGAILSSGQLLAPNFDVGPGVFRTVSWDNARRERGESVPRIAGLPVMEVQVAASRTGGGNPLMVVAQQLESGQVIRTIEGPAIDVTKMLAARQNDTESPWPTIGDSAGIAGGNGAMAVRRGDRILAITAPLSSDSLRAMIRRLNVTER